MDIRDVFRKVNSWEVFGLHLESITWHGCTRYAIADNRYIDLGVSKSEFVLKNREIVIKSKEKNIVLRPGGSHLPTLHPYSNDKRLTLLYSMHIRLFTLQERLRKTHSENNESEILCLIREIQKIATQLGFIPLPTTLEQMKVSLIGRLARLMARVQCVDLRTHE